MGCCMLFYKTWIFLGAKAHTQMHGIMLTNFHNKLHTFHVIHHFLTDNEVDGVSFLNLEENNILLMLVKLEWLENSSL